MVLGMRTVVALDPDVLAAVDSLRRERGIGLSEAVNVLIRGAASSVPPRPRRPFDEASLDLALGLGLMIDVTNVAESLDLLRGPAAR